MQNIKARKLIFTFLGYILDSYALGAILFLYLLVRTFVWPGEQGYFELLILTATMITALSLSRWMARQYDDIIVSGRPRTTWRYCCFSITLPSILIYLGKYIYDYRHEISKSGPYEHLSGIVWLIILLALWIVGIKTAHAHIKRKEKIEMQSQEEIET